MLNPELTDGLRDSDQMVRTGGLKVAPSIAALASRDAFAADRMARMRNAGNDSSTLKGE